MRSTANERNNVAQPLPDEAMWKNQFTGWSVWEDVAESRADASRISRKEELGLFITEANVATHRLLGWAAAFAGMGIFLAVLIGATDIDNMRIVPPIPLIGAFYMLAQWLLNRDLQVRIFRNGFTRSQRGVTQTVFWRDVEYVRESWSKSHGSYAHKVEVYAKGGQVIKMNQMLQNMEWISNMIQSASAEYLLPASVKMLESGGALGFNVFKVNRYGIIYKDNKFLPWSEVKSLEIETVGTTLIRIRKIGSNALASRWAVEYGGNVFNLHLFIVLASWFIKISKPHAEALAKTELESSSHDAYYRLFLSKKEGREGVQKVLYVGLPGRERKLVVRISAGVKPGTMYRFPDYGYEADGVTTGVLHVDVAVNEKSPFIMNFEILQISVGAVLFLLSTSWLGFDTTFGFAESLILSLLIGVLSGALVITAKRWIGAAWGSLSGAISFVLQYIYYRFMYIFLGRESFWNYEMAIVFLISLLPAIGLVYALFGRTTVDALFKRLGGKKIE